MTSFFLGPKTGGFLDDNVVETYTTEAPPPKVFGPDNVVPSTGTVPIIGTLRPQILPAIDVTVPGGHLLDITPKVITTETRVSAMPWWVWALIAVGAYMVLSGKAGRRRSSW